MKSASKLKGLIQWNRTYLAIENREETGGDGVVLQKALFLGNNISTLWYHIHSHFDIYETQCNTQGIETHHHVRLQENAVAKKKKKGMQLEGQMKLMMLMTHPQAPQPFTPKAILHAAAQFVVCDDHVSKG